MTIHWRYEPFCAPNIYCKFPLFTNFFAFQFKVDFPLKNTLVSVSLQATSFHNDGEDSVSSQLGISCPCNFSDSQFPRQVSILLFASGCLVIKPFKKGKEQSKSSWCKKHIFNHLSVVVSSESLLKRQQRI